MEANETDFYVEYYLETTTHLSRNAGTIDRVDETITGKLERISQFQDKDKAFEFARHLKILADTGRISKRFYFCKVLEVNMFKYKKERIEL